MYMHFANRHDMRKMNNFDNKIIDACKKKKFFPLSIES